jgi:hypothetical protein
VERKNPHATIIFIRKIEQIGEDIFWQRLIFYARGLFCTSSSGIYKILEYENISNRKVKMQITEIYPPNGLASRTSGRHYILIYIYV